MRNEQLIDPAAGAVVGDSAPAPCHVGNQVLRSRDDPFERASLGRAIARNKLSRRDGQAEFLVSSRDYDVGGRRRRLDRLHGSMPRFDPRFILRRDRQARYFMRSRRRERVYFDARVMQLPRDADRITQRSRRERMRSACRVGDVFVRNKLRKNVTNFFSRSMLTPFCGIKEKEIPRLFYA